MNFGIMQTAPAKTNPTVNKQLEQLKSELYDECIKSIDFEGLAKERVEIVKTFAKTSYQNKKLKQLLTIVEKLDENAI